MEEDLRLTRFVVVVIVDVIFDVVTGRIVKGEKPRRRP